MSFSNPTADPGPPAAGRATRTVPLCTLQTGDHGRVATAQLRGEECELLRAMGIGEQCELRVCRSGARCIIQVNATRLGLSRAVTRKILVSIEEPRAASA